ncbi:BAD_HP_G0061810.mRNA.1.CDS.1 [Saccharomyces cerevisiae]|nr:BAD_HP_G0061810.mRNA.1.CDS.1 [Saccharomyces cerevisiae]CAI6880832.1 BAD_HP_G0061810.mRNA.1.CDS.1 [Saccharomyces cerevisiae]
MTLQESDKFATKAIHAGEHVDVHGSVIEPISLSTTFKQSSPANPIGTYEYSRSQNPNRENLERAVAALENAQYGLAFSSGSATTATILQSLPQGSHAVSIGDVYGGTHRYFTKVANAHGVETSFTNDLLNDLPQLIKENTKLVWIETPTNPTLKVTDIQKVADLIKKHAAGQDVILVVDNTFLSPYISNPLNFGADIVVHSATKYINGHSDVVLGVLATNNKPLYELQFLKRYYPISFRCLVDTQRFEDFASTCQTSCPQPQNRWNSWQTGKTSSVNYPGLKTHPNYDCGVKATP